MTRFPILIAALASLALAAATGTATAAWPHDPNNGNVPVCTAASHQYGPEAISDGAGGTIAVWLDLRGGGSSGFDLYAQRLDASGVPLWTATGVALCTATEDQWNHRLVSDGAGGAIVAWTDRRTGTTDIYAQRLSPAGVPLWTANGVGICTLAANQAVGGLVADGVGGAFVSWEDYRSGTSDIYAQRVNAAGAPQWAVNGVAVCTATNLQNTSSMVNDASGGAILAWRDYRAGGAYDLYAQRLNAAGATQWTANGVPLCTAAGEQTAFMMIADGAGGAIVTWHDYRADPDVDIYAQRVSATGATQWLTNGVAVCTATAEQYEPTLASDGVGGAIVTWRDYRAGANTDIYAQRVNAAGAAQWTANGVGLCTAALRQAGPECAPDGAGGAIVVWIDERGGNLFDVYAQRVSATGAVQWTSNGAAICTAVGDQQGIELLPDGAGGATVFWDDGRAGTGADIYAQRIERYGQLGNPEPVIAKVQDLPGDQGGFVKVSWDASYLDADPVYGVYEYRVFRSAPGSLVSSAAQRRAVTEDSDVAVRDGALLATTSAGATVYWEYMGTQTAEAFAGYSRVVATTTDSIAGSNPRTWVMVEARASTSVSSDRWASAPDSGYSVDNLPPASPAPFTGQYAAGAATLHWNPNTETDLAGYRLYRGSSVAFVPGPGNLVVALLDAGYTDAADAPYVYKLTAVDAHGNESPVATLIPAGTLGVGGEAPPVLAFAAPRPNPAAGATTLRWTLSRAGHVRLSVFDAAGRRVAVLRDGMLPAGEHIGTFAMRGDAGSNLPSGLYLLRLEAEGRVLVRRLAAIR